MGLSYVVQLKSSRLAKFHPGPRHSRFKLKELFQGMKKKGAISFTRENAIPEFTPVTKMTFLAKLNLWIPGKGDGKKQIKLNVIAAYNHPKDSEAFGYYATNDLSASSTWCWNMCRCRWNIEVCFRDLRQGLRWGQFAAKTPQGAELALLLPILIQSILHEKDPSTPLLTKLSKLRNLEMLAALEFHIANPKNQQLKRLKSTLGNQAQCKKVKITAAEKGQERTNCKKRLPTAA